MPKRMSGDQRVSAGSNWDPLWQRATWPRPEVHPSGSRFCWAPPRPIRHDESGEPGCGPAASLAAWCGAGPAGLGAFMATLPTHAAHQPPRTAQRCAIGRGRRGGAGLVESLPDANPAAPHREPCEPSIDVYCRGQRTAVPSANGLLLHQCYVVHAPENFTS